MPDRRIQRVTPLTLISLAVFLTLGELALALNGAGFSCAEFVRALLASFLVVPPLSLLCRSAAWSDRGCALPLLLAARSASVLCSPRLRPLLSRCLRPPTLPVYPPLPPPARMSSDMDSSEEEALALQRSLKERHGAGLAAQKRKAAAAAAAAAADGDSSSSSDSDSSDSSSDSDSEAEAIQPVTDAREVSRQTTQLHARSTRAASRCFVV